MGDYIAAASVIVALVTWSITQLLERRSKKAAHTAEFLSQLSTNEALAESNLQMSRLIDAGKRLDRAGLDETTERHVTRLLNFYEYMSGFYYQGVLDQRMVRELRGGPMRRAHRVCEGLIIEWRQQLQAPKLFEHYERLVREVTPGGDNPPSPSVVGAPA
jgi:hypothetical protein